MPPYTGEGKQDKPGGEGVSDLSIKSTSRIKWDGGYRYADSSLRLDLVY